MKRKIRREFVEWIILLGVFAFIYLGGWHTEVIGRLQQVVLATGIISPDQVEERTTASYNFILEDLNGNTHPFSDHKDQVVFLNFWATWCPPCVAEMPDIHSLYEAKSDSIQFIMISLDQDKQKARDFIERKGFEFPVYFLKSTLPSQYKASVIPTTYVIDRNGLIRVENKGMAKYNTSKFRSLLSDLSKIQEPFGNP